MIFVLDIGTRSIVGLLGTLEDEKFVIQQAVVEFHRKRVMYDGQIHDVEGVMEIVKRVKEKMEEITGFPLKEVSIAAAGRALKTFQTTIEKDLDEYKEIDKHLIDSVEIEGIQQAQRELEKDYHETTNYFCVGHTVINYYLNDGLITNPIGHRGKKLRIDILATFLPKIVVDSLYTVMGKVGLEVAYLTLEPIAAIEVAVPENMRLLNIVLVDIGAGTSDIAITKEGTVTAFGMTSTAGDEITEELARTYLLDFDTAEKIKCNLSKAEQQSFTDIVGIPHQIESKEILDQIQPAIELVAKEIADNILMQNGKSPSVVFLIGGGSQTSRLNTLLAEYLQLPKERVVVRGMEIIQNLQWDASIIEGPEGITPIGILVKALKNKSGDYIEVKVNNNNIRMLKTKVLRVSDALVLIGFNPRDLIPQKGESLKVYLNNEEKIIYGEYGEPAKIVVNSRIAHLDTSIEHDDTITIHPATAGKNAVAKLREVINLKEDFFVNDSRINPFNYVKVNGKQASPHYLLQQGDRIEYILLNTVQDLCQLMNTSFGEHDIYVDGKKAELYQNLEGVKQIIIDKKEKQKVEAQQLKEERIIEVVCNGESLKIAANKENLIFVDIFNYIDFDRTKVKGRLILKHNGNPANYTEPLQDGDELMIYWE
ncbi:cell division protein FtsA [Anaerovirgula multivorans]|uniref:Cell division protein FtsA n=1 Tax=Anaerovirgula multivorans TaxID=312168 RepID=A0A239H4W9_9FIRM|nr:cell division FtsA domain-containing protein [Anaerovirgula multivorans]SNS76469.1 cell division protein FtsA [Anaerovirgula multivorans]